MDRTLKRVFGSLVTRWRTIQRTTHTTPPTWKTICCIILEPESRGSASHHRKRRLFLNWFMITWATTTEYTYGYKWNNYTAYNPSRRSSAAWNPVRLRCMVYETANGCVMLDTIWLNIASADPWTAIYPWSHHTSAFCYVTRADLAGVLRGYASAQ